MAERAEQSGGQLALIAVMGLVVLIGLVWWAMAGGARPTPIPLAPLATFPVPQAGDEAGLRALVRNPAAVARGQVVFKGLCITCHGAHGQGDTLGPNLRDDHWLVGSSMSELLRTISDGRPGTAMQPMRQNHSAADIVAVAAYVVTLKDGTQGSDKAAEGAYAPITYWP